jgi:murein DD-endopeptidase MepM/ murein hydrolase activator NlpD
MTVRPHLRIRVAALLTTLTALIAGCGSPAGSRPRAAAPSVVDRTSASASPADSPSVTPPSAAPSTPAASPSGPYTTGANAASDGIKRAFPVIGKFSYARTHHDYPASDIIAACGLTAVAVLDGVVLEVTRVDTWKKEINEGSSRGGLSVSILGDDGVRYYGSHYSSIRPEIEPGVRVKTGQPIAIVGRTGDAGACHVHFGLSPACAKTGDWFNRRGLIWPWPYLDSWRNGGTKSPVAEIKGWQAKNGCPTKPLTP